MRTRTPLAAIYCYVVAVLVGLSGIITVFIGLVGAGTAISAPSGGPFAGIAGLFGVSIVYAGCVQLLIAGGLVAAGLVVHDIRRIAENTSAIAANQGNASLSLPAPWSAASKAEAVFFYFEKTVEHGPVSRSELAALIRSNRVSPFQRIEKSVGGVRQPFDTRELEP